MKQGQVVVFLVKPDEISAMAQGHPLVIRPTNGMPTFLIMADPPVLPVMNGRPPAALMEQPIKALRHPNRTYHCGLCQGRAFPNQSAYMRHQIKVHRGGRVKNGIKKRHAKS